MQDLIGMVVHWGTRMDVIVVEDGITSIYVQALAASIAAMNKALSADGQHRYLGLH